MKDHLSKSRNPLRQVFSADVDLTPIMSLFIILVPLLLLTAVFERLSALKVYLPHASTIEETDDSEKKPSGIIELSLLIKEDGLLVEATLSHDPSGEEKEIYEDIQYEIPLKGDQYDLIKLKAIMKDLKQKYPNHIEVVFLVDDKVSYNIIVQVMDICREDIFLDDGGERTSRPLFPSIALSETFSKEKGYEGLRKGTRALDKKLGIQ